MLEIEIASHANHLRENCGLDLQKPIEDIVEVVELADYDYVENSFGNAFSGLSRSLGNGRYLIGFNNDHFHTENFRRFTISHELGHLSIPEHRNYLDSAIVHYSMGPFQSSEDREREADRFAVNFLTPVKAFRAAIKKKEFNRTDICEISNLFGFSLFATAMRFVELTELACSLIVCKKKGSIHFEQRSKRLKESMWHEYIQKSKVPKTTLTFEHIHGKTRESFATIQLNDWYPELEVPIEATESVIELDYSGQFLALVTPAVSDIREYIAENSY